MIYFDNNATTRVASEVRDALLPYYDDQYANPSGSYAFAHTSAGAIATARQSLARLLGVNTAEIVFTSGGTESINTTFENIRVQDARRNHLVTSAVEHVASRASAKRWAASGGRITELPVNARGEIDKRAYEASLTPDTGLVSIMAANNETGVLFPVDELASMAGDKGIPFHCDATQVIGKTSFRADLDGLGFVSLSGHKFHGPKGIGVLVVRKGEKWSSLILGGDQEQGRRAGTENVPGIVGLGSAAKLVPSGLDIFFSMLGPWRDEMEAMLKSSIPGLYVVGEGASRLANTSLICVPGVPAEVMLAHLDMEGICCSSGSACSAGATEESHVLRAMGVPKELSMGAIRISFSRYTEWNEVEHIAKYLPKAVNKIRALL